VLRPDRTNPRRLAGEAETVEKAHWSGRRAPSCGRASGSAR
jgi:hypothetical protein